MVREVNREDAEKFLKKAENFYEAAADERSKGRYDVAIFNSTQSIILANDALCVALLGKRPSKDHLEAVELHVEAAAGKENRRDIVKDALEKRSEYGYTEISANEKEANILLVRAKRFLDWIKGKIGYE